MGKHLSDAAVRRIEAWPKEKGATPMGVRKKVASMQEKKEERAGRDEWAQKRPGCPGTGAGGVPTTQHNRHNNKRGLQHYLV